MKNRALALAVASFDHAGTRITLLDAPGYPDFSAEVAMGFAAADGAVFLMDASGGVGAGTELAVELGGRPPERRLGARVEAVGRGPVDHGLDRAQGGGQDAGGSGVDGLADDRGRLFVAVDLLDPDVPGNALSQGSQKGCMTLSLQHRAVHGSVTLGAGHVNFGA